LEGTTLEYAPTRRGFLLGTAAVIFSSGVLLGGRLNAQGRNTFENALAIPPVDQGRIEGDVRIFDLSLQSGQTEFFGGLKTATNGINASYLAPVLRMHSGETVRMNVTNNLTFNSTLHWHGLNVPARADGGPHQVIEPKQTWSPEFTIHEKASTMWYHSHQLHETASQVWSGLAGMMIIDDAETSALDLPDNYGVNDVPLVLQDRRFYRDGSMPYERSMHDEMAGMVGNVALVNGTVQPFFEVTSEKIRLRLLNGANASIYNLAFSDGRQFAQVASDGGLLSEPVAMTELRLAPGERAEIVVEFEPDQNVQLNSIGGGGSSGMGMMQGAQNPVFNMIEFRSAKSLEKSGKLPESLANLPNASESDAVLTRSFLLEMPGMGPMRMMGLGGGFTIDGQAMDMDRVDEVVKIGDTEIWEITNTGPMIHPFHIHNTQFRILDRDGRTPPANEAGLKDTVVVDPGETVRLLVRFENYTDEKRPYMYHCHILEHEDAGMMGQFTVV